MAKKLSKNKDEHKDILDAISELAMETGAGFDRMDKRFNKLDAEIADIRQDIQRLEAYILRDHERRIEELERRAGVNR